MQSEHFDRFFNRFTGTTIIAGDFNAKSPLWGSRLTSPKGRQLVQAINKQNLRTFTGGTPTYWPTDRRKTPDVIDFIITRHINPTQINATPSLELSSDHSPTLIQLDLGQALSRTEACAIGTKVNWAKFQTIFNTTFNPNMKLKSTEDIDNGIAYLNDTILECIKNSTTSYKQSQSLPKIEETIIDLLAVKRRAKQKWQEFRSPRTKTELTIATKKLKSKLLEIQNKEIQSHLEQLTHKPDNYSPVYKTTKNIKKPITTNLPIKNPDNKWMLDDKNKCEAFADHLEKTFTPLTTMCKPTAIQGPLAKEDQIKITTKDVTNHINRLKTKKAAGMDNINGKAIKSLPLSGHTGIANLFNGVIRLNYFPRVWKHARIIMIPKPGKNLYSITSYRPISLLPILSKMLEKLILVILQEDLDVMEIIPEHQFGFRRGHGTIEQVHKIVNEIKSALEDKSACVGIFLDVSQAFDKVNHYGLMEKIQNLLPIKYHKLLDSYLSNRTFQVQYGSETSLKRHIKSGVPQGSVLGPVLYLIYTSDLPTAEKTVTTTFADDTAILCTTKNPEDAKPILQKHMDEITNWCKNWGIKLNEDKSVQITFTLRRVSCPPIKINNRYIPIRTSTKYLGVHLDRRLTWKTHITKKKEQINLTYKKLRWLLNKKSKMNINTKMIIYKTIIKPIWTYGIQLWGSACTSNLKIIDRCQSKIIREILGAPRYVTNKILLRDLQIDTVIKEATRFSEKYINRLTKHPNVTARRIIKARRYSRLKRTDPLQLAAGI